MNISGNERRDSSYSSDTPTPPKEPAPIVHRVNSKTSVNLTGSKRASGEIDKTTNKLNKSITGAASTEPSAKKGRPSLLSTHRNAPKKNEPKPRSESLTEEEKKIELDEEPQVGDVWGEAWKNLSREGGNIKIIAKHVGEAARTFFKAKGEGSSTLEVKANTIDDQAEQLKRKEATIFTGKICLDYYINIAKKTPDKVSHEDFRLPGNNNVYPILKKQIEDTYLNSGNEDIKANLELLNEKVSKKEISIDDVLAIANSCIKEIPWIEDESDQAEQHLNKILKLYNPDNFDESIENMSEWIDSNFQANQKIFLQKLCESLYLAYEIVKKRKETNPAQKSMPIESLGGLIAVRILKFPGQLFLKKLDKIHDEFAFLLKNYARVFKTEPKFVSAQHTESLSKKELISKYREKKERPLRPAPSVRQNTEQAPKIGHRPLPEPPKKKSTSDSVVFSSPGDSIIQPPNRASSPAPSSSPKKPPPLPPRPPSQPMKKSDSI